MESGLKLSKTEEERAQMLHRKSIFVNACDSTPLKEVDDEYFDGLLKTGITAMCPTLYSYVHNPPGSPLIEVLDAAARWHKVLDKSKNGVLAKSVEDIEKAKRDGKLAVIFGTQNADFILDPTHVKLFSLIGYRIMQLTYQHRNLVGDGSGEKNPSVLSNFGVKTVEEMNSAGIVIDLSHVSKATALDTIRVSKDPVIYSHSSAHSIVPTVRNRTDEEIKAIAEKDGVMGIVPKSNWIKLNGASTGTTVNDYVNVMEYVMKLVGADHVGVGLDIGDGRKPHGKYEEYLHAQEAKLFPEITGADPQAVNPMWTPGIPVENVHVKGISPPYPEVVNITRGLVARGYSDQEITKIIGGNFLRVFKKVWK